MTTVTGKVNSKGVPLNKRQGPGTSYPIVGSVADGTTVTIVCQTSGTTVTGPYGPTSLWDRLPDNSYVTDAFVYTGTNNMVAPRCSGTPQGTIQQRLNRFISDWQGKFLTYNSDPDQCYSVAQEWSNIYLGLHLFTCQNARDIIEQGGTDYTRVDKNATNYPPPGAIVVFHEYEAMPEGIGIAGHVDVCISANSSSFVGFDQNWGSPKCCRQVTHDYRAVTGWLIPNRLGN